MIKFKKLTVPIALIILFSIFTVGCASTKQSPEPDDITITIGDKKIDYVVEKNKWNGVVYDRKDTFKTILSKISKNDIQHIKTGETVIISFPNNLPSKFTISDILIDDNGNQRYSNAGTVDIPVELIHGKCSFKIKKHIASGLSSFYVKGKTDIRGFRMIAAWGENECEYAFIIRTDSF